MIFSLPETALKKHNRDLAHTRLVTAVILHDSDVYTVYIYIHVHMHMQAHAAYTISVYLFFVVKFISFFSSFFSWLTKTKKIF